MVEHWPGISEDVDFILSTRKRIEEEREEREREVCTNLELVAILVTEN